MVTTNITLYFFKFQRGDEDELLRCVEFGDIPGLRHLMARKPGIADENITDILGRTPLRLAVENEHLEVTSIMCDLRL